MNVRQYDERSPGGSGAKLHPLSPPHPPPPPVAFKGAAGRRPLPPPRDLNTTNNRSHSHPDPDVNCRHSRCGRSRRTGDEHDALQTNTASRDERGGIETIPCSETDKVHRTTLQCGDIYYAERGKKMQSKCSIAVNESNLGCPLPGLDMLSSRLSYLLLMMMSWSDA